MTRKAILLGAATCAAFAGQAWGQTTPPKKHSHETVEQRLEQMERVIHEQEREIGSLKAQVTKQEAQSQTAAQQTAQPQVTAAQFDALQSQVYEQAAATKANESGWWHNTKISGRMYYDITNLNQSRDHTPQSNNGTSFDIKRFYVGIDHKFNDIFSANVTTDFTYDSGAGATQLYIKKAYLDTKLSDALDIRLGSSDMPWIPFMEGLYGYRYVENTLIDRTKFGTSADWGVYVAGKLADGLFDYSLAAVDGAGYKHPFRSQGIDFEGRVNANIDDFVLGVGGYAGKLGKNVEGATTDHTASRIDAVAAYKTKKIRLGFEYFHANNWNNVTTPASDSANGFSVFGSYQFNPCWGVFGRFDWVKPTVDTNAALKDKYFNVGVSYSPEKDVDFALVYKREKTDNGFFSTSNGTMGGPSQAIDSNGNYDEFGLWGTFQW